MKLININFLIVLFSLYSFGQNKDSIQIKILPKWEINDIQKLITFITLFYKFKGSLTVFISVVTDIFLTFLHFKLL